MKKSILILGIALVTLSNVCNAKNTVSQSLNVFQSSVFANDTEEVVPNGEIKLAKPVLNEDAEIFNPETVIAYNRKSVKETIAEGDEIIENATSADTELAIYQESMTEIIAQSDLIIKNIAANVTFPLYSERTIEDEIAEMELIIESTETNEASPLDFKKINNNSLMTNTFNSKRFVGMN